MPTVEELQEALLKEKEEKAKLASQLETINKQNSETAAELARVKEFNQKLYLRITEDKKVEEPENKEPEQTIEDMAKELFKI